MKKLFLLISFVCGILQPIEKDKSEQNSYYVINVKGAELYAAPSLSSKVLQKLVCGEKLVALKEIKTKDEKVIGPGFSFKGSFVKVNLDEVTGYVFTSDLSKSKPKLTHISDGVYAPNLYGQQLKTYIKKRMESFDDEEFEITDEITEYDNVRYTYTPFDGCFTHNYVFKNLSLSEVYHQAMASRMSIGGSVAEDFIQIAEFKEKKGNEYHFYEIGATDDFKIVANNDGTFTVETVDCT